MKSKGNNPNILLALRIAVGILSPLLAGVGFMYVYIHGSPAPCGFYTCTGLNCPGCGSGRALEALLHLRIGESLGDNGLLLPLGLPASAVVFREYLRFVFPGMRLRPLRVPNVLTPVLAGVVIAFWILRNLPWFAFLAP